MSHKSILCCSQRTSKKQSENRAGVGHPSRTRFRACLGQACQTKPHAGRANAKVGPEKGHASAMLTRCSDTRPEIKKPALTESGGQPCSRFRMWREDLTC